MQQALILMSAGTSKLFSNNRQQPRNYLKHSDTPMFWQVCTHRYQNLNLSQVDIYRIGDEILWL